MGASKHVTFEFEGRVIEASVGDTVASALLRAGVETFSRGPKYHRPRGPFCFTGHCAQCHMRIGGEPNVPACQMPVSDGLEVERQNVIGSGDTDLLRAVDFLYPGGIDHHHLMTHFRVLNTATKAIARRLAGVGELPADLRKVQRATTRHHDLIIIGGGRAGVAAARAAVAAGVPPLVLERENLVASDPANLGTVLLRTLVLGLYEEGGKIWILARTPTGLLQLTARFVILATGTHERPLPFEGNDLPGVFGGRGLLRLVGRHGVIPGRRAIVLGSHPDAITVARDLRSAGLEIAAVVDPDRHLPPEEAASHLAGARPLAAEGRARVKALRVSLPSGEERRIACDLIAVVAPPVPSYELAAEAGAVARPSANAGGFIVSTDEDGRSTVDGLFAAGSVTGASDSLASGTRAGQTAVQRLLRGVEADSRALRPRASRRE